MKSVERVELEHLMRRASLGVSHFELETLGSQSYEETVEQLLEFEDDISDNKQMIVENTQEIHQAFEAIMENTELLRHTKETLTKRLMELYGPY